MLLLVQSRTCTTKFSPLRGENLSFARHDSGHLESGLYRLDEHLLGRKLNCVGNIDVVEQLQQPQANNRAHALAYVEHARIKIIAAGVLVVLAAGFAIWAIMLSRHDPTA
jgi:hypothetical protein